MRLANHEQRAALPIVALLRLVPACLLLLLTTFVHAAPPRAESGEYQRAIRGALAEFEAGNFPEARALFVRAHELFPNARTYRGLGFVEFELRNYRDSVDLLESALSADIKPLEGDVRRSTEELLDRARDMIARVVLRVTPRIESLLVDGVPTALPEADTLILAVGDHVLEARAAGFMPERRPLKIARGGELIVTMDLRSVEAEPASGPRVSNDDVANQASTGGAPANDAAPSKRAWYKSPWLWTSVAIVAVGAGVGTYFLLRRDEGSSTAAPPTTANTPEGGVIRALRSF